MTSSVDPAEIGARIGALLAGAVGARFWVCMSGPAPDTDPADVGAHLLEHLEYVIGLEQCGALFAAGPFLDEHGAPGDRAMYVLRADSEAAARALVAEEPLHRLGLRTFTLVPWQLNQGRVSLSVDFSRQAAGLDGPPTTPTEWSHP